MQNLRRAVQLKQNNEAEKLEALISNGETVVGRWLGICGPSYESERAKILGTTALTILGRTLNRSAVGQSGQQGFKSGWGWADSTSASNSNWGWDNVGETKGEEDEAEVNSQELMSPSKLEAALYKSLSQKSGVRRQSLLPPTPRGAYYEQQRFVAHEDDAHGTSEKQWT